MQISARNQLKGTVDSVKEGAVSAIVTLKTQNGEKITATISMESVKELGLTPGKEAVAVIKATEVMIGIGEMQISARNQLSGEIIGLTKGAVNTIVSLKTEQGSAVSATISNLAVEELRLVQGTKVKAIIKATSVMISI